MVPQVFGEEHIIYMIVSAIIGAAGLIFMKKYAKPQRLKR